MSVRYVVWDDVSGQYRPWSPDEVSAYPLAHVLDSKRRQHTRAVHSAGYWRGLGNRGEGSYWLDYARVLRGQIAHLKALS